MADGESKEPGRVEFIGTSASGTDGIAVTSDVLTYRVDGQPDAAAANLDVTTDVLWISVSESRWLGTSTESSEATIALSGDFKWTAHHPIMTNVQLWCTEQSGNWGRGDDETELHMHANGSPTVAGSADDPHLQFACRLELKVPDAKNVILHFTFDVDSEARFSILGERFEEGQCELWPQSGGKVSLQYRMWDHG